MTSTRWGRVGRGACLPPPCASQSAGPVAAVGSEVADTRPPVKPGPHAGDVFREYEFYSGMYVLKYPGWKDRQDASAFEPPLAMATPVVLGRAVRAEVIIEIANVRLGWEDMFFRRPTTAATRTRHVFATTWVAPLRGPQRAGTPRGCSTRRRGR